MKWHQLFVKDVRGGYRMPKEMHEVDRHIARHRALVIASPESLPDGAMIGTYEIRSYGNEGDIHALKRALVCLFDLVTVSEKTHVTPERA